MLIVKQWRKPDDDAILDDSQRLDLERQFDSWPESNTESQHGEGSARRSESHVFGIRKT